MSDTIQNQFHTHFDADKKDLLCMTINDLVAKFNALDQTKKDEIYNILNVVK